MGVIPIVNENDTLAVSEIKFGDNDTLSAITAAMVGADYLFLMTDVDGLYTSNPRTNPDAQVIEVVEDISSLDVDVSTAGSSLGTGGMSTKIVAARLASSAGVTTVITRSSLPDYGSLLRHLEQKQVFSPRALWQSKGHFSQQEAVRLVVVERRSPSALNGDFQHHGEEPKEVGRALVNYGSAEIARIKGSRSTQIQAILGYADSEYVALRENIFFFHMMDRPSRPGTPGLDEMMVRSGAQSPAIEKLLAI
ncbi:glutamate 5-kinase [Uncinocarpus reesii 1704]|uniref:Glutamate 5-kinase n=1 Tax=Uncinocarpus reesii (strain UAMH 1704) TaxID=336963 RepID=C4JF04_UNCRE|nr:glutamate 5-kinase [Uncinocarpus reesii 1704]EEP76057.1 glutamate 5-kinase [Uncinocarpus reesii 1704]